MKNQIKSWNRTQKQNIFYLCIVCTVWWESIDVNVTTTIERYRCDNTDLFQAFSNYNIDFTAAAATASAAFFSVNLLNSGKITTPKKQTYNFPVSHTYDLNVKQYYTQIHRQLRRNGLVTNHMHTHKYTRNNQSE